MTFICSTAQLGLRSLKAKHDVIYKHCLLRHSSTKALKRGPKGPKQQAIIRSSQSRQALPLYLHKSKSQISSIPSLSAAKNFLIENALPPLSMLRSAHKANALEIDAEEAVRIIRQFSRLSQKGVQGWEQKFCPEHDISPSTLAMLGAILNRCNSPDQKLLAKVLMLTASTLGDATATMLILKSALQRGTIPTREHEAPMRHLHSLAQSETNLQAMVLLGKILEDQGDNDEALKWFRKAAENGLQADTFDDRGAGDALVYQGLLLQREKDRSGAAAVFQRAALELDNPLAFYHLAQLEDSGSKNREVYLLKAAVSGIAEACRCLGVYYLKKRDQYADQDPEGKRQTVFAKEWLTISAEDGCGLSMLDLASIYHKEGHVHDSKQWLERAKTATLPDNALEQLK